MLSHLDSLVLVMLLCSCTFWAQSLGQFARSPNYLSLATISMFLHKSDIYHEYRNNVLSILSSAKHGSRMCLNNHYHNAYAFCKDFSDSIMECIALLCQDVANRISLIVICKVPFTTCTIYLFSIVLGFALVGSKNIWKNRQIITMNTRKY